MRLSCAALLATLSACGASGGAGSSSPGIGGVAPEPPLEVVALGVSGFLLVHGDDAVLTAPLFSRATLLDVAVLNPIPADVPAIDAALSPLPIAGVRAILAGHAHYDHLMDVPRIMSALAPDATLYSNRSAAHLLAAVAPDRAPGCTSPQPAEPIERSRVVALDDPAASLVDYRGCPEQRPDGAPLEGSWVRVPGARVRLMALCAEHPAQVGGIHFGPGSVDEDRCELPLPPGGWLEGQTMSFLLDFLDEQDRPVFRVYYQDTPGSAPIGTPPPELLAGKRVDLALLCVGTFDKVRDHPGEILRLLEPRWVLSGHWEDFFQPADQPPVPLPFTDVDEYRARAEALVPGRNILPVRGTRLVIEAER